MASVKVKIKPTLKRMILKLPKDLVRGKIILRARHLNIKKKNVIFGTVK